MELEICEACIAAYEEEGLDTSDPQALEIAAFLGEDLPDHFCDEIEEGGSQRCNCACHSAEKKKRRQARGY